MVGLGIDGKRMERKKKGKKRNKTLTTSKIWLNYIFARYFIFSKNNRKNQL